MKISKKDFLSITDLSAKEIWQILSVAKKLKEEIKTKSINEKILDNNQMVMLFEKPSLRTKLSFDIAMNQLGGHSVYFGPEEIGLGKRESVSDVSKVVASMADLIVARVFNHKNLEILAENSKIPVINALSDLEHPCQALADFLTIWEIKDRLEGLILCFIGDGENNVPHSLSLGCALLGLDFICASPKGYRMDRNIVKQAKIIAKINGSKILETEDPKYAAQNADVIYTDTWVSMGDEIEKEKRLKIFQNYQVNKELMSLAKKDAIFMHDMPANRGCEVEDGVIDSLQSVVFQQAENRLHTEKALIALLLQNFQENSVQSHSYVIAN